MEAADAEPEPETNEHRARRDRMVDVDLAGRGIRDRRVLQAMRAVPRHRFVPEHLVDRAHDDNALPIEEGQTISQPFIVALMAEAAELTPTSRVLEVGTGSGYGAAVLGALAADVWTIERHAPLAELARERLAAVGTGNVHIVHGDGTRGLVDHAPYDAIVVTAGAAEIPPALTDQLADGGRLVMPVGAPAFGQRLVRVRRRGEALAEDDLGSVRFVPLVADQP